MGLVNPRACRVRVLCLPVTQPLSRVFRYPPPFRRPGPSASHSSVDICSQLHTFKSSQRTMATQRPLFKQVCAYSTTRWSVLNNVICRNPTSEWRLINYHSLSTHRRSLATTGCWCASVVRLNSLVSADASTSVFPVPLKSLTM